MTSEGQLASDLNVDIVAVSINVPQHYDLIRPALEAGKDFFCEWPLARNLTEAEELVNLAKEKNVRTMVGLQARQNPSTVKAKELVNSGKLGRILGTTMYGHGAIFGPTISEDFLYVLPLETRANLMTIPFGHAVDALCYVLGEVKDISASLANLRPELELLDKDKEPTGKKVSKTAHDYINKTGALVDGAGIVNVTYAGRLSRVGRELHWEINSTEGTLVLEGGKMGGYVQMFQPSVRLGTDDGVEDVEVEKAPDFSFNVGKAWDAWAGFGVDKGYSVTTWEDALVRHRMIEALYRSAESGRKENYL